MKAGASKSVLLPVICLMLIGLACKAGMFPLHGWLPKAHPVAPSPASALLSGNITKMGILFTVRVIFYSVGQEFLLAEYDAEVHRYYDVRTPEHPVPEFTVQVEKKLGQMAGLQAEQLLAHLRRRDYRADRKEVGFRT